MDFAYFPAKPLFLLNPTEKFIHAFFAAPILLPSSLREPMRSGVRKGGGGGPFCGGTEIRGGKVPRQVGASGLPDGHDPELLGAEKGGRRRDLATGVLERAGNGSGGRKTGWPTAEATPAGRVNPRL
ncbi:hypothetical protein [Chelativorans sp.]|uniref:hypothetical protein n=1 Tax=Chelativorans sp. TaxID=2203393 RepID=UPI002810BCCB|nr:hypothetical protein [Chelativorans sp.]